MWDGTHNYARFEEILRDTTFNVISLGCAAAQEASGDQLCTARKLKVRSHGVYRLFLWMPQDWCRCAGSAGGYANAAEDPDHEQVEGCRGSGAIPDGSIAAQPHELFGRVAEVCAYVCGNAAGGGYRAAAV